MRLRTIERSVGQQGATDEVSEIRERLSVLNYFTNKGLPAIRVILESIQHRIDSLEVGTQRQPRTTQNGEEPRQPKHRDIHEDLTDNEEEDEALSTHVCKKDSQAETYSAQHQNRHTTASYYTRTRSNQVDQTIKQIQTGQESDSSSEEDYDDDTYVTGNELKSPHDTIVSFHSHPVGTQHIGLRTMS